ncbi:MAG TPA: glucuronate isomerase, partial [Algoriphagus sp.]|nr:glucuronate isomerase [Algoriphagus sp.]
MSEFIHPHWLIKNKTGEYLYHEVASVLPIIDYHNHINPALLAADKNFKNLSDAWITEDPYKHRAMRILGLPEAEITGDSSGKVKFDNWVKTLPKTLGNPLFHWSALELKRVFGVSELLNQSNADQIWDQCNELLGLEDFKPQNIVKGYNTELLVTSDDLLDDLRAHQELRLLPGSVKVLPSLRADSILDFGNPLFPTWLKSLSEKTSIAIRTLDDLKEAIRRRLDYFNEHGCIFSDHGLDSGFKFSPVEYAGVEGVFE